MKQTITQSMFVEAFKDMNREENFSLAGRRALFDYLTEYEESCDTEIELDVIALCCEYTESTITEALKNYDLKSLDELKDRTQVIDVDAETIIYQVF